MDVCESDLHSFIVKIWLETVDDSAPVLSHGYVTHVSSGERRYFKRLSDITDFIEQIIGPSGAEDASIE